MLSAVLDNLALAVPAEPVRQHVPLEDAELGTAAAPGAAGGQQPALEQRRAGEEGLELAEDLPGRGDSRGFSSAVDRGSLVKAPAGKTCASRPSDLVVGLAGRQPGQRRARAQRLGGLLEPGV